MHIDSELAEQARRDPDGTAEVIITCHQFSPQVQAEMEQAGLKITGREQAEHGLIYGSIRLADLTALKGVSGIESVSRDSEQHIM